jgi:acetyl-CoA carboxylase biotin carboxyl carrier protein
LSAPELTRQEIETIIQIIMSASDVTEFSLKYGSTEIYISRDQNSGAAPQSGSPRVSVTDRGETVTTGTVPAKTASAPSGNEIVIKAPMVGTFYRSPAPLEPPFVEVGQAVETGAVLCIIEVMKLMNSIPAERSGKVKAVLVGDGEAVEFGQPLIVLQIND